MGKNRENQEQEKVMSNKFKIIMSDLHLGAGYEAHGNRLEDFRSDLEFAGFLAEICAESERSHAEVELILNGDIFEMLQVPHVDCFDPQEVYSTDQYRSFAEIDSALKIDIIIAGHRPFFDALSRFIRVDPPRRSVTFIKGNHDLDLHWPAVRQRIRRSVVRTGDSSNQLLTFEEWRICREGIYVEHGNQYEGLISRVNDMEQPISENDPTQIEVPLGSWFMTDVFNRVERDRYWIDGVKPITALIWYALAYDFAFAVGALGALLQGVPGIMSGVLSAHHAPNIELIRDLDDPKCVGELTRRYNADPTFRAEFNSQVAQLLTPLMENSHTETLTTRGISDARTMARRVQDQTRSALYRAAQQRAAEMGVQLVVFGHTHEATRGTFSDDSATYFNSGTWTWHADFSGEDTHSWRELFEHPDRFTNDRQLSYVRIDYDKEGRASGDLKEYEPASYGSLRAQVTSWFPVANK
jgi:UDP-2,3-diacylglucosamine pyrophosphatase LpxH